MQVVEDEHDRRVSREPREYLTDGVVEARGFRLGRHRYRFAGVDDLTNRGREAREDRGVLPSTAFTVSLGFVGPSR